MKSILGTFYGKFFWGLLLLASFSWMAPVELSAGNSYITVYPKSRNIHLKEKIYLSLFTKDVRQLEIYFIPIERHLFEQYSIDPWSKKFQDIMSQVKPNYGKSVLKKNIVVQDGANYLKLDHNLRSNYYLLAVKDINSSGLALTAISVSNLGLIAKQSESELLLYTVDLTTGKPWPDVKLEIKMRLDKRIEVFHTNGNGLKRIPLNKKIHRLDGINAVAKSGRHSAQLFSGQTPYMDSYYQVYIDTDRPIYKIGHSVNWYAIVQKKDKNSLHVVANKRISYDILNPGGQKIYSGEETSDSFGRISAKFKVPEKTGGFAVINLHIDGANYQGNVLVKDYQKPALIVNVKPDKPSVVYGDHIRGIIQAKYLFGAIPKGASVNYKVYKGIYNKPSFGISSEERFFDIYRPGLSSQGDLVSTGEGVLDDKGEMEFLIKTEEEHKNSQFTIIADVSVRGNASQLDRGRGQARVKVLEGDRILSLRQNRFIVSRGSEEQIQARVLDLRNRPVANQNLELIIYAEKWDDASSYRRTGPTIHYRKVLSLQQSSDKNGTALFRFSLVSDGHYNAVVRLKDSQGKTIKESVSYWVADSQFSADVGYFPELNVQADKRFYRPGERAKILITSRFKNAPVFYTVEADHIYSAGVVQMRGNTYVLELPLGNREYVPNIYVHAITVHEGRLIQSSLPVFISPKNRFINIKVKPDKEQYHPGDKVSLHIETKSFSGKGLASSLTLAVVDESIFLSQKKLSPSIEKFFYGRRPNRTQMNYSFPLIFSGGADKSGDNPDVDPEVERKDFKDTAYFNASVQTDQKGKAQVQFTLPGNLTTWRISSVANSRRGMVGSSVKKFISSKELLARLSVPRFLNTGSSGEVTAIVHNTTKQDLDVELMFRARGLTILNPEKIETTIPARSMKTFSVTVSGTAESKNSRIRFYIKSRDNKFSDSLEKIIPVFELGLDHILASRGALLLSFRKKFREKIELKIDPQTIPSGKLKIKSYELIVYPNLLGTIFGSLEYLVQYPHGCVEQTTSRFLPNILVKNFMKKHRIRNLRLERKLDHHIRTGIQRLLSMQNESRGAWGWWQSRGGHAVNHWMTAYALYGLVLAKNAGYQVDSKKLESGLSALHKMMLETGAHKSYTLDSNDYPKKESFVVFANYVLTLANRGDASIPDAIEILREKSTIESLAWTILTMKAEIRGNAIQGMQSYLLSRSNQFMFQEEKSDHLANSSQTYYNSLAINGVYNRSLLTRKGLELFIKNLLANRNFDGKIISTRDTSISILALLQFLDSNLKFLKPSMRIEIDLPNGKKKKIIISKNTPYDRAMHIPLNPRSFSRENASLSLSYQGLGLAQVFLHAKAFEATKDFKSVNNGIEVVREYQLLSKSGKKAAFSGKVKQGNALEVRIQVNPQDNSGHYLMATENIPPGFVVESDFDYSYGRKNVILTKEKIYFYMENYYGKSYFTYRLRAINRGSYLVAPTKAELMYRDTINGSSKAEVIRVD